MNYLYVDNFRGFTDTYIPLHDINFLVGENSTGKTSILSLLRLLSTREFWMEPEFNTDEVKLGHFEDIVSANSEDNSYFSIGIITDNKVAADDNKNTSIEAFLLTFTQKNGLPRLAMVLSFQDEMELRFKLDPKRIQYKQRQVAGIRDNEGFIREVFVEWVKAYRADRNSKGYTTGPKDLLDLPPLLLSSAINHHLGDDKKQRTRPFFLRTPRLFRNIAWLAPIRAKPQRTYDEYPRGGSPEGKHTPYLIKRILSNKKEAKAFRSFIEEFGRNSGLFESIAIKPYGSGATAPFELDIVLNNKPINVSFVGYGVSQSLPVIVELFERSRRTCFLIQQPEVHLHPKAQAALGDTLFELAVARNQKFFIETHSDYIIDRLRIRYRRQDIEKEIENKPQAQILFFQRDDSGNQIHSIPIGEHGELPDDQPKAYREFFIHETMDLLEI